MIILARITFHSLFQNYLHACVCMQIRFLICIHAREATNHARACMQIYNLHTRARSFVDVQTTRARVCKSNLHTRARSFMHSCTSCVYANYHARASTKDLVPFYDLHLCLNGDV